jgi:hypothetical protein
MQPTPAPTPEPAPEAAASARRLLGHACRNKNASARLAAVCRAGEAILVAALVLALADYWLILPALLRWAGALVLLLLAMRGAARWLRHKRRPGGLKQAALDLERQRPETGCEVSTAAEYLTGERGVTREYEPELVAALETKAVSHLRTWAVDYASQALRPALLLAATALLLFLLALATPGGGTAWLRTFFPFAQAHYTRVEVKPGDVEIPVGQSLEITNVFSGRAPRNTQVRWQPLGQAQWQTAPLARAADGTYRYAFKDLRSNVAYRVSGNDAVSPRYTITTYVPPAVKDLSIRLTYPDYTRRTSVVVHSPNLTAVRASSALFTIQPATALAKARLRFTNLPDVALTPNPDGTWTGGLSLTKDSTYWIELADAQGHRGGNDQPYHIKALPDHPPKVEMLEPGKDIRAAATNKVRLRISAADDFGVAEVRLVYHKLGGPEHVLLPGRESERNGEVTANAELDLAPLGLRNYELVAYHAEATDNNTLDGPGVGRSPVYFIEITNEEGTPCLSQGQGQRVNLLVIQKQIIAETTALAPNAAPERFSDLAARQNDAAEFGRLYQEAIATGGAPPTARTEMAAAIQDMETAKTQLESAKRATALPPEESALAHLYQVLQAMPELADLPIAPSPENQRSPSSPKVKVVLEAIKQRQKSSPDNRELADVLEQARNLARSQAGLNSALPPAADAASATPKAPGQAGQRDSEPREGPNNSSPDEGFQGAAGNNQPATSPAKAGSPTPGELAAKEEELSREAAALAERLRRLAGKDSRLGHGAGQAAGQAATRMAAAGQALRQGSFGAAGEQGFRGELALRSVIAQLERLLRNRPEPTDVAAEDCPKEYEALISEYLKRLSHAE